MKKNEPIDINKLLKTDPVSVLRMGKLEARKYFRALVNEANKRLEELERERLTMTNAYVEYIDTLRTVKGKKRFTVPTDDNLSIDEVRTEMLYKLHGFLKDPSSSTEYATKQKDKLKTIFKGVLTEYRLIQAWAVIDNLRKQFPERFMPGDSRTAINEIKRLIVKRGLKPDEVETTYRKHWLNQYEELSRKDKEYAENEKKQTAYKYSLIHDEKNKDIFNTSVEFDYKRKQSPYKKNFYEV